MKQNYSYPLMSEWSKNEIITMVEFYSMVEDAYTIGVNRDQFLNKVRQFKTIEPSIAVQKKIDRKFKEQSGYSIYHTIQAAQKTAKKRFKMED